MTDSVHPTVIPIAVVALNVQDEERARRLSQRLALPLLPAGTPVDAVDQQAALVVDGERLWLQQSGPSAPGPVEVDFGSPGMRHRRRGGANELLGKAVGVGKKERLQVLDATAGLGRDAFVLADLGCEVHLREREPIIAALLESGLDVARSSQDAWLLDVAGRMHLEVRDARDSLNGIGVDVIYLDPMFAPRSKSAAVKKEMAVFQRLLDNAGAERDAEDLLTWALAQDAARVVVKRPLKGARLTEAARPSHSIRGKAVRYDVYARRKLV